jgi:hypothetical protein
MIRPLLALLANLFAYVGWRVGCKFGHRGAIALPAKVSPLDTAVAHSPGAPARQCG